MTGFDTNIFRPFEELCLASYMLRRVCWLWATPTLIMHTIPLILQAHGMHEGPWYAMPGNTDPKLHTLPLNVKRVWLPDPS